MTTIRPVSPAMAAAHAGAVRAAALLAPAGTRFGSGAPLGGWAALAGVPDSQETARRERIGLGAVTSVPVLAALLGLPHGLPVPVAALSDRERRALAAAPAGCVDRGPDGIVRQARPPLAPALAVVAATRGWRAGLERAGRFAPFCARAIVLDREPRDLLAACVEADFYGVGLVLARPASLEVLVAPEPHQVRRISARSWWFAEQVHQAIITRDERTEAGAP
ncbi:hypothetical protein [Candidatus Frankia alpina]|uniref:Uncharacterized protein n=1 Tax=Candidatus Frankia alpina TaxID=2699483 RepID=A0A4S5EPV5_9ACTN|nr:hypothetical protein [Candidatus Frankia alpina]THJ74407.1 hypothetical protein E7Y31_11645 [Candidatus Frankia alpina]